MNSWLTRVSGGVLGLALVASAMGAARADVVHLSGTLFPPDPASAASGKVTYFMQPGRATLSVTAANVIRADAVDVFVNGDFIGTIALDPTNGSGSLNLDTDNGDDVPTLQDGDEIEVFDAADDTRLILIGNVGSTVTLQGVLFPSDPAQAALGKAVYMMQPGRMTLTVAATNVPSISSLDVFVNGDFIGTLIIDPTSGNGKLSLDTDNGDDVPTLQDGDEIEVFDASDDTTLILIGNVHPAG